MPKKKSSRKVAETLRVASLPSQEELTGERVGSLLVVQGAEADLGRHILCDRPITIGRDEEVELSLADGSTSRQHCRVERLDSGHYILVDLDSTNGTSLNGRPVEGSHPLTPGDKIFLGGSVVRFAYADGVDVQYQSRVSELVTTDGLTGLMSRRAYQAQFEVMAERARAENAQLSLLVIDMDGLKKINDTHGHEMGGHAIVEAAHLIEPVLEAGGGIVARFGGDEFVAAFPGTTVERAAELAEEARAAVENAHIVRDGVVLQPTLSIGVAAFPTHVDDPDALFSVADRALYRAKRTGRNRVTVADESDLEAS
jgi:diguanylate cyclase (GGDEF)-like protein